MISFISFESCFFMSVFRAWSFGIVSSFLGLKPMTSLGVQLKSRQNFSNLSRLISLIRFLVSFAAYPLEYPRLRRCENGRLIAFISSMRAKSKYSIFELFNGYFLFFVCLLRFRLYLYLFQK